MTRGCLRSRAQGRTHVDAGGGSGGYGVLETGMRNTACGAARIGFDGVKAIHWNLSEPVLYEHAIAGREATIAYGGALAADTGIHTGRSPKDKFIVRDALTERTVWWDNNNTMSCEHFARLFDDLLEFAKGRELFVQDLYGGADPAY